jgi:hypothetical protein
MTEPAAPTILAVIAADLTLLLSNLTIEIVAACSEGDDPQSRQLCQRLRRIADTLRAMDEASHSPMLHRVLCDVADRIDQTRP